MQPRDTGIEQVATELGGHFDPTPADLFAIVAARLDATNDVGGNRIAGELRHALDRNERCDRHDAGEDRPGDAAGGQLVAQALVLLDLEKELRDREVSEAQLERQMLAIRDEVGGPGMAGRMSRNADRLEAQATSELDQLRGVLELLVRLLRGKRIAAEREQVLEPRRAEAADDLAELEARVRDARQVRHRREVRGPQKVDHDSSRPLPRDPPAAVRD